jgi:CheY-like chemotaxis protein
MLKNRHIFIVEDDLSNRAVMQMLLEKQGAKTAIERWGLETVPRLLAFMPVDIILLDLMLPGGVSGFDVYDQIKSQLELATIPVVAVSAMDPSLAIPQAQAKGLQGFIPKPVDYKRFARQVASVLENEPVWSSGTEAD